MKDTTLGIDGLAIALKNMVRLEKLSNKQLISEVLANDIADNQLVTELLNRLEPGWQDKEVGYYSMDEFKEDVKFWFYKNKKTGEVVKSSFIDSSYWNNDWNCINDYNKEVIKPVESGEKYLIWSNERNCWWAPHSRGYTEKIEEAGRYSLSEALEIEKDANGYLARGQEPKDVKLKENDVLASRNRNR